MAPPPSGDVSPVVGLAVRVMTVVCLVISIAVVASNTYTISTDLGDVKVKFNDYYAYRYFLSAAVIGLAYSLLQTALTVLLVTSGNRIGGESMLLFDFYGDKVISYFIATGAAASFGFTVDSKRALDVIDINEFNSFLRKAEASASMCLLASVLMALSSVFSSFSLPKRVQ